MKQRKIQKLPIILTHTLLLIIPTTLIFFLLFYNYALAYLPTISFVGTKLFITILSSMLISYIVFTYRLRFFPITIILFLLIGLVYNSIEYIFSINDEFDTFYTSIKFAFYAVTFLFSWTIGFGFARVRIFSILLSIAVLLVSIILFYDKLDYIKTISDDLPLINSLLDTFEIETDFSYMLFTFFPVLFYSIYIIYIKETLFKTYILDKKTILHILNRIFLFLLITFLFFFIPFFLLSYFDIDKKIQDNVDQSAINELYESDLLSHIPPPLGGGSGGNFDMDNYLELLPELRQTDSLLFVTKLDHFYDKEKEIPNPLYYKRFHVTQFDVENEKFHIDYDSLPLPNDLMSVSPEDLYLLDLYIDSSLLLESNQFLLREEVEIEVYLKDLVGSSFIAPSLAYSCERKKIDEDFEDIYHTVYAAMANISKLNSARFIYNTGNEKFEEFQELRNKILREVKNYNKVDSLFLAYYTKMEKGPLFDSIQVLSDTICTIAETPVDKINALRDYFLSKDDLGEPLFKYSLVPGNPIDHNKSMLEYFLFENRKGYCTYFAYSTLFLLRAQGIPSRIVTGFSLKDRNTPGWYWVYGYQAHAWVEVYFPRYGWLDFDTTIPGDGREEKSPDGTPPEIADLKGFMAVGTVKEIGLDSTIHLALDTIFYEHKGYLTQGFTIWTKLKQPLINSPTGRVPYTYLSKGEKVLMTSYGSLDNIRASVEKNFKSEFLDRLPVPLPIDLLVKKQGISLIDTTSIRAKDCYEVTPQAIATLDAKGIPLPSLKKLEVMKNIQFSDPKVFMFETAKYVGMKTAFNNEYLFLKYCDCITPTNWKLYGKIFALFMLIIFLFPFLFYSYLKLRIRMEKDFKKKIYYTYFFSEFLLHQFSLYRSKETPLSFATKKTYTFTDKSWKSLLKEEIPIVQLSKLKRLKNRSFNKKEEVTKVLVNYLGRHEAQLYEKNVLPNIHGSTINERLDVKYSEFINTYLKYKYSEVDFESKDEQVMDHIINDFPKRLVKRTSPFTVFFSFFNFIRTFRFLYKFKN